MEKMNVFFVRFVFKPGRAKGRWFLRLYLGSFLGGSKPFNLRPGSEYIWSNNLVHKRPWCSVIGIMPNKPHALE